MPRSPAAPPVFDAKLMARHADAAARLLKSLAHQSRLLVMCRLVDGEASVGELQSLGTLSMSALSQHLAVMREAGLVNTRREAQTIYYSLADGPALSLMQALHEAYCAAARKRATKRARRATPAIPNTTKD